MGTPLFEGSLSTLLLQYCKLLALNDLITLLDEQFRQYATVHHLDYLIARGRNDLACCSY